VVARISYDSRQLASAASGLATYDELLKEANLRMSFDKQSFYETDGQSYVRDLSGHGNDGQCENVNFTRDGRFGGGLENDGAGYVRLDKSVVTGQPEFTIAAWVNSNGSTGPQEIYAAMGRQFPAKNAPRFHFRIGGNAEARHIFTAAWNGLSANPWIGVASAPGLVRADQWTFVAVTFQFDGTSQGQLRMYVGDRVMKRAFQTIGGEKFDVVDVVGWNLNGTIDELVVWQRALSDEELIEIYRKAPNDRQQQKP
jgi:hypothetical protein